MTKYKNHIFTLSMLATVFIAAWVVIFSFINDTPVEDKSKLAPDAYMEGVTATVMDKLGKPKLKINSTKLTHFRENDTTRLQSPALTIYRQSPNPWYVNSNYAIATHGTDKIDFWENVVLHHAADENNPATVIKTEQLTVHPQSQTAETKNYIELMQPSLTVHSVGMFADMDVGSIKLLSKARGIYEPG